MTQQASKRESNFLNKNSAYIDSLVSFILDTKPYHSKLTEIIEEYQFSDKMHVKMLERLIWRNKLDSHWLYSFFSGGNVNNRRVHISRPFTHTFNTIPYTVGVDDVSDFGVTPNMPKGYSPKSFSGLGVANVRLVRGNGSMVPLTESLDYHLSRGAFRFQVKQTESHRIPEGYDGEYMDVANFDPTWYAYHDESMLAQAIAETRKTALDWDNPNSSINLLYPVIKEFRNSVANSGIYAPDVIEEIDARIAVVESTDLPNSYQSLYDAIDRHPGLAERVDLPTFRKNVTNYSPSLFFHLLSDMSFYEGGLLSYRSIGNDDIYITDIEASFLKHKYDPTDPDVDVIDEPYEEFTVKCVEVANQTYTVIGSTSGYLGTFNAGETFTSNRLNRGLTFRSVKRGAAKLGDSILLTPSNRIAIHPNASLSTWNIIKTNPIAYTRPGFKTTNYGHITNLAGVRHTVDLIDPAMPTGNFILTYIGDNQFTVTNTALVGYSQIARVNQPFNDGIIGFVIRAGQKHGFRKHDMFVIQVKNDPAEFRDLGIVFGYDVDPYDNTHITYDDNPSLGNGRTLDFFFESRFPDFKPSEAEAKVNDHAVHKRKWRCVAIPDLNRPISTVKKDGSGPNNSVDLDDATSGTAPDPAIDAPPVYERDGNDPNLKLYYSDEFRVEYSDDDFNTVTVVGNLKQGETFNGFDLGHHLSFKIPVQDKPFIGVESNAGVTNTVKSGDILYFMIWNPPPELIDPNVQIIGIHIPRLNMHAQGFYDSAIADWEITFKPNNGYTLTGVYTAGKRAGTQVPPLNGVFDTILTDDVNAGYSIEYLGVTFSIMPNAGLTPGESFVFSTKQNPASYLVHNSVKGWMKPAVIGEYYWNGEIGFKLELPTYAVSDSKGLLINDEKLFSVTKIRPDHPSISYRVIRNNRTGMFMLKHPERGVIGNIASNGVYQDDHISFRFDVTRANELFNGEDYFVFEVIDHKFELPFAHDVVIIHSEHPAFTASDGNTVLITKTSDSDVALSITNAPRTADLNPEAIDLRVIDMDAPKTATSPELNVLTGWIPTYKVKKDSKYSKAAFFDPVTEYEVYASATGEKIGDIGAILNTHPNENVIFEFTEDFFTKYMPVNTNASIITTNPGWKEAVSVNIEESMKLAVRPGAFPEDFGFFDPVTLTPKEDYFKINTSLLFDHRMDAEVEDDFDGFVPGYGNEGYDLDGFDTGQPIEIHSLLKHINLSPTDKEVILGRWQVFLINNDVPLTTGEQWDYFWKMLKDDPAPGAYTVTEFGIPHKGMAVDQLSKATSRASTSISEGLQIKASRVTPDSQNTTLIIQSNSQPTSTHSFNVDDGWVQTDSFIECQFEASVFEISFATPIPDGVKAWVWESDAATPTSVTPERISKNSIRLTIPVDKLVKIDLVKE